jgi:hypothetical protein
MVTYPNETVTETLTITNNSEGTANNLQITSLSAPLSITSNTCGTSLNVNNSCTISIQFSPKNILNSTQNLIIKYKNPLSDTSLFSQTAKIDYSSKNKILLLTLSTLNKMITYPNKSVTANLTLSNNSDSSAKNLNFSSLTTPLIVTANSCGNELKINQSCRGCPT